MSRAALAYRFVMWSTIEAGQWELDLGTGILNLCQRSREMFGLPLNVTGPIREEEWVPRIHIEDLAVIRRALRASLLNGTTYAERFRAIRTDGSFCEIFGVGSALDDLTDRARIVGWNVDVVSSARAAGNRSVDYPTESKEASIEGQVRPARMAQRSTLFRDGNLEVLGEAERLLERAETILRVRGARGQIFGHAMMTGPAFDLLLTLYVLSVTEQTVSLSRLARAAGVPGASAWRWFAYLVDKGFVVRCRLATDRRAVSACLTDAGRRAMNDFLALQ